MAKCIVCPHHVGAESGRWRLNQGGRGRSNVSVASHGTSDDGRRWVGRCNGTSGGDTASVCIIIVVCSNSTPIFTVVQEILAFRPREKKRFRRNIMNVMHYVPTKAFSHKTLQI
eukprot:scaffold43482_cov40-Cyclotella_meneghiniana.AAC.2